MTPSPCPRHDRSRLPNSCSRPPANRVTRPPAPDLSAAKAPVSYKSIRGRHSPGLKGLRSVKKQSAIAPSPDSDTFEHRHLPALPRASEGGYGVT